VCLSGCTGGGECLSEWVCLVESGYVRLRVSLSDCVYVCLCVSVSVCVWGGCGCVCVSMSVCGFMFVF